MVEIAFHIEDFLKNQGIIKHNSNKNNNNNGNKNRSNSYKGNQCVINDGIVDAPKSNDQAIYKLSISVHAMKLQASSQQNNRDNSRYNYRNPQERRTFTKIGRPYEDVLEELVDGKLLNLIEK